MVPLRYVARLQFPSESIFVDSTPHLQKRKARAVRSMYLPVRYVWNLVGFQIESLVSLVLVRHSLSSDSDLVSVVFSLTYKEISFINLKL